MNQRAKEALKATLLAVLLTAVTYYTFYKVVEKVSPDKECLSSIAPELHDPESGKVLGWVQINETQGLLRYSATNGYGARVQNQVLCSTTMYPHKWKPDLLWQIEQMRKHNALL